MINFGNISYKLNTWLKRCGKYWFVGVIEYESNIILWVKGCLSSCDPETDPLADTASYVDKDPSSLVFFLSFLSCLLAIFVIFFMAMGNKCIYSTYYWFPEYQWGWANTYKNFGEEFYQHLGYVRNKISLKATKEEEQAWACNGWR